MTLGLKQTKQHLACPEDRVEGQCRAMHGQWPDAQLWIFQVNATERYTLLSMSLILSINAVLKVCAKCSAGECSLTWPSFCDLAHVLANKLYRRRLRIPQIDAVRNCDCYTASKDGCVRHAVKRRACSVAFFRSSAFLLECFARFALL